MIFAKKRRHFGHWEKKESGKFLAFFIFSFSLKMNPDLINPFNFGYHDVEKLARAVNIVCLGLQARIKTLEDKPQVPKNLDPSLFEEIRVLENPMSSSVDERTECIKKLAAQNEKLKKALKEVQASSPVDLAGKLKETQEELSRLQTRFNTLQANYEYQVKKSEKLTDKLDRIQRAQDSDSD